MKTILKFVGISLLIVAAGCSESGCTSVGGDDKKPVAPEIYQDGGSQKGDPQLPDQKPWWK